jgi:hypothetical protein
MRCLFKGHEFVRIGRDEEKDIIHRYVHCKKCYKTIKITGFKYKYLQNNTYYKEVIDFFISCNKRPNFNSYFEIKSFKRR